VAHSHTHSHGLVPDEIARSKEGLRAVTTSLAILGLTAAVQAAVYVATGSIALLADLVHNGGDALTALPLGAAFVLRSTKVEQVAGLAVVAAIFVSALTALALSIARIVNPLAPEHLLALGLAGAAGAAGNAIAARVRTRAGRRLDSPALIADGQHARSDALVSLGVIASALAVEAGATVADPIVGLLIAAVILRITAQSWRTVRAGRHAHHPLP
jgi:cation diffusion facilitator family transporter